tara:strand:- start:14725 stop:15066 length:342 start_codon:yes stop_codon:yes gene_type:complete
MSKTKEVRLERLLLSTAELKLHNEETGEVVPAQDVGSQVIFEFTYEKRESENFLEKLDEAAISLTPDGADLYRVVAIRSGRGYLDVKINNLPERTKSFESGMYHVVLQFSRKI